MAILKAGLLAPTGVQHTCCYGRQRQGLVRLSSSLGPLGISNVAHVEKGDEAGRNRGGEMMGDTGWTEPGRSDEGETQRVERCWGEAAERTWETQMDGGAMLGKRSARI